ncbi:MAG TPA: BON domain-containing protein [Terriglobia bacterium]
MNPKMVVSFLVFSITALAAVPAAAQFGVSGPSPAEVRIAKEVRHELNMLPYVTVFDYVAFQVQGSDVKLTGGVTRPVLKSDAGRVVKGIEGVQSVDNQIEVLPPSSMDDQLRRRLYQAIYGYPPLQKYALGVLKPIRIVVKSGRVSLEGVVDNEADKNLAYLRANGVSGAFSVTNNLQVVKP